MDFNPFQNSANFVELLNSQQNVVFGSQSEGSVSLSSSQAPLKWCLLSVNGSSSKRRKFDDGSHSASSHAATNENNASVDAEGTCRPPGVKAAKARAKKPLVEEKEISDFHNMWSIKKEDLAMKEKITKMKLLDSLVNKQVPLDEYEEVLKKKLINELM
ncbi:hypothetical protein Bca52824_028308 [Brassica carinata]|uniref:No apical meristem-associated C-terminal domain-containing protein n=1 Tax=Brassica carinata TaxID=52824 RepID=A0A8X8AMR2_BRACI|nr:hypothetical protein Bca52824_028308 [Brassica carinata]